MAWNSMPPLGWPMWRHALAQLQDTLDVLGCSCYQRHSIDLPWQECLCPQRILGADMHTWAYTGHADGA